ncbi:MAG TPA: hypothetical protein VNS58_31120 [Puia sp.]|nr:hypothetical protein [Puia sp.]
MTYTNTFCTLIASAAFIMSFSKPGFQPTVPSYTYDTAVNTAFYQGSNADFNCASVAVIKASLCTFGQGNIFKSSQYSNGSTTVVLRNNEQVIVTDQDQAAANAKCGFIFVHDSSIFKTARLMYAVMAKKAVLQSTVSYPNGPNPFQSCQDLTSSLLLLHGEKGGINAEYLPVLLGLKTVNTNPSVKNGVTPYVFGNTYHAVFAFNAYFDNYGQNKRLTFFSFWAHYSLLHPGNSLNDTRFLIKDI